MKILGLQQSSMQITKSNPTIYYNHFAVVLAKTWFVAALFQRSQYMRLQEPSSDSLNFQC